MKAIIYNIFGQILRVVDCPETMLIAQKQENEFILFGEADLYTQYIDVETAEIRDIPPKPNDYSDFNWETKQWELDPDWVIKARVNSTEKINQFASQKILSKYPIYKQLNIGRTSEAQVMYDWIDNIRNLSNIATASIAQAVTQEEITPIVDNFKTELGNIA